jgi:hypothetical protein
VVKQTLRRIFNKGVLQPKGGNKNGGNITKKVKKSGDFDFSTNISESHFFIDCLRFIKSQTD